jgi:hypothetical protein
MNRVKQGLGFQVASSCARVQAGVQEAEAMAGLSGWHPISRTAFRTGAAVWMAGLAIGAAAQAPAPKLNDHVKADIERHRAMAVAHEAAARCLASARPEAECLKDLQVACKGLAIGKYCGMKHGH